MKEGLKMSVGAKLSSLRREIMRARFATILSTKKRVKWLKKHQIFAAIGKDVLWATRFYPVDAKRLKLHNNIIIARNVNFIMHDENHLIFNNMKVHRDWIYQKYGCIEIMDNVSIGSGAQICPDVRIGPNAIVGAGAVVTRDVPPNSVVAGVPARVIGTFDDLMSRRIDESSRMGKGLSKQEREKLAWERFYLNRSNIK